jgi:hypothetical protein
MGAGKCACPDSTLSVGDTKVGRDEKGRLYFDGTMILSWRMICLMCTNKKWPPKEPQARGVKSMGDGLEGHVSPVAGIATAARERRLVGLAAWGG